MVLLPELLADEGRLVVEEGRAVVVEGRSFVVAGRCDAEAEAGRLVVVGRLAVVGLALVVVVGRDDEVEEGRTLLVVVLTRLEEAPAVLVVLGFGVRELSDPAVLLRRTEAT